MNINKSILAVGSIAIDDIQTPNGSRKGLLGGSASYFSVAAGILTHVKLVGVVGKDYPSSGWKLFSSAGANTDNVVVQDGKTFRWGGKYSKDYSTRETLFTELGVFESFIPSINADGRGCPFVFLGNIQPPLQLKVVDIVGRDKYIVADTMNLWIDLFSKELKDVLSLSTIFLINHEEAEQLTGESDVMAAARNLLACGPKAVIIKMGGKGAYLLDRNNDCIVPVFPVDKVLDPTGAGDSFAGGLMGYLSQNNTENLLDAVIMGSALASFCVEGFGLEALLQASSESLDFRIKTIKNLYLENTPV